jgi:predicted  nucleic acid-binding Zn-ribbon protein
MSVSDDERELQELEKEKAALQSQLHNGYTDAARFARLESAIRAVEGRITRAKQRAEHGEG